MQQEEIICAAVTAAAAAEDPDAAAAAAATADPHSEAAADAEEPPLLPPTGLPAREAGIPINPGLPFQKDSSMGKVSSSAHSGLGSGPNAQSGLKDR